MSEKNNSHRLDYTYASSYSWSVIREGSQLVIRSNSFPKELHNEREADAMALVHYLKKAWEAHCKSQSFSQVTEASDAYDVDMAHHLSAAAKMASITLHPARNAETQAGEICIKVTGISAKDFAELAEININDIQQNAQRSSNQSSFSR